MIALVGWAVVDGFRTTVAMGHYEDRIIVVTHDNADVGPPWFVYLLLEEVLPRDMVTTVVDRTWTIGLLVAAAAFIAWLYAARRDAERLGSTPVWARWWAVGGWFVPVANLVVPYLVVRDVGRASDPGPWVPIGRWWASVLATAALNWLSWLYGVVTADGGTLHGTALDSRNVAYPLWMAGTVAIGFTAYFGVLVIWRITEAQRRSVVAATTDPA